MASQSIPFRIWQAPYQLRSRGNLNSKTVSSAFSRTVQTDRRGCLLRIESIEGVGFADVHPWPELGDETLDKQLELLTQERLTPLTTRSLYLACLDLSARSKGESAFLSRTIPESHFLATDISLLTAEILSKAWNDGFRSVKLKLGRDLSMETQALLRLEPELAAFRLRFDFNGSLALPIATSFFGALTENLSQTIEFVEDPMPWKAHEWQALRDATGVELALDRLDQQGFAVLDREVDRAIGDDKSQRDSSFGWIILKPAVQSTQEMLSRARAWGKKVCVTSYLDHPVGQMGAALEASHIRADGADLIGTCGLLSQGAYETNEFSEAMQIRGPNLLAPTEPGIGFGALLERLDWKELK